MRIYIKGKLKEKNIDFEYRELAAKMWFKEKNGKELEISHVGNDETLQENLYLSLSIDKWLNDNRWSEVKNSIKREDLDMEVVNIDEVDYVSMVTKHIDVLTVDKRAFYIMAIEIAQTFQGSISQDERNSWKTIEELKKEHEAVLTLSYDEANEISLKETEWMIAVEEPWDWEYEDDE